MGSNILPLEAFYYSLYAPFLPITRARHRFMCAHTPHAGSLLTLHLFTFDLAHRPRPRGVAQKYFRRPDRSRSQAAGLDAGAARALARARDTHIYRTTANRVRCPV